MDLGRYTSKYSSNFGAFLLYSTSLYVSEIQKKYLKIMRISTHISLKKKHDITVSSIDNENFMQ